MLVQIRLDIQGFRFFQDWWAEVTHGAKNGGSFSEMMGPSIYLPLPLHICILTTDYTVKPALSGHSKKKTNYRLMQVKSIAEEEHSAVLSTFIKLPFVIKIFVLSFFEWLLKTCFTVLTTYMYFLFCGVRRLGVR